MTAYASAGRRGLTLSGSGKSVGCTRGSMEQSAIAQFREAMIESSGVLTFTRAFLKFSTYVCFAFPACAFASSRNTVAN